MDNLCYMTIDFLNFLEIHLNDSCSLRDPRSDAIELFEIGCFLPQLCPKLVMQSGRQQHSLLAK